MNTVITKPVPPIIEITAGDLIGGNMRSHGYTAFIGSIGGYKGLFLITYEGVILANEPNLSWNGLDCAVTIDHYCAITITEE